MLYITIPATTGWDPVKEEFVPYAKEETLQLEHSLVSLQKWESKWCKPFFSNIEKTPEEVMDYIKCMTVTRNVKDETYDRLTMDNINEIQKYINAPMTATTFSQNGKSVGKTNNERITAELVYYWMISYNIPPEYRTWHLNQLLTLIRVCGVKNQPPKKMSKRDIMSNYAARNAARRQQLGTTG